MIITEKWLREWMGHSPNKRQMQCLGLDYPLTPGWMKRVIGNEIDGANQRQFESLKGMSQHAQKIKNATESGDFEAFYITTHDGKGSWTGRWGNEFRWHWPHFKKKA